MTNMTEQALDPAQWVDQYGDDLYAYALSRLNNAATAEDVVQETFLAALSAKTKFSGRSSPKTWLIGILRHKIVDAIRKESRERVYEDLEQTDETIETCFDKKGMWQVGQPQWRTDPRSAADNKELQAALLHCLDHLPDRLREIFVLRELENESTEGICKLLAISSTNVGVMLYRARMGLRNCLNKTWFGSEQAESAS